MGALISCDDSPAQQEEERLISGCTQQLLSTEYNVESGGKSKFTVEKSDKLNFSERISQTNSDVMLGLRSLDISLM